VIKPDSLFTVENLGMPFHKRTYQNGNLIIQFKIKFPTQIDAKSAGLLQDALGGAAGAAAKAGGKGGKKGADDGDAVVCELKAFTEDQRNTDHRGGTAGHHEDEEDEDDDGHGHGQRVGCQQQ
jgi:DnaJ C terminal domain